MFHSFLRALEISHWHPWDPMRWTPGSSAAGIGTPKASTSTWRICQSHRHGLLKHLRDPRRSKSGGMIGFASWRNPMKWERYPPKKKRSVPKIVQNDYTKMIKNDPWPKKYLKNLPRCGVCEGPLPGRALDIAAPPSVGAPGRGKIPVGYDHGPMVPTKQPFGDFLKWGTPKWMVDKGEPY